MASRREASVIEAMAEYVCLRGKMQLFEVGRRLLRESEVNSETTTI